jgi:hypothetical protein
MKTKYYIMKTKYVLTTLVALLFSISSCDKGFVDLNINPIKPASLDPVYMLNNAEQFGTDIHHYEAEICQQMQLLIGGQEEGGNRNTVVFGSMGGRFDALYGNQIKNTVNIISLLKDNPDKTNLYNMARIIKAYSFQWLVDTYGDVPYFDAGQAYLKSINLPKYDVAKDIYDDLVKELTEAVNALDPTKDAVSGELLFAGNIAKWKKFGNSELLRIGMRYTKYDPARAKAIVLVATDGTRGGVMTSNADNVVVKYNATQVNPSNQWASNSTKYNWHVGKPFVDFLQANNDPRLQYLAVRYTNAQAADGGPNPNTNPAQQIGCPYGYSAENISTAPGYPGSQAANTFNYSQFSRQRIGRVDAYLYQLTYAQTALLMAEATYRGYISTGTTAEDYYKAGITAHMTIEDWYSTTRGGASPITAAEIAAYLAQPAIVYNPATALKQINEQYWVACVQIWQEAWHNRERSGYPILNSINYPGEDPYVSKSAGYDGFIHRLMYPQRETTSNTVNCAEAATRMGGDNFSVRLFWDKRIAGDVPPTK